MDNKKRINVIWEQLFHWFTYYTFSPAWLSTPWNRRSFGYLVALILPICTTLLMGFLLRQFPEFIFIEDIALLVIVLVALTWGAGPSLMATFIGATSLLTLNPTLFVTSAQIKIGNLLGISFYIVAGCIISVLASQVARARAVAEAQRQDLQELVAALEIEKRNALDSKNQLEVTFEAMTDLVYVYDANGKLLHANAAGREVNRVLERVDYIERPLKERFQPYHVYDESGQAIGWDQWPIARILRGETLRSSQAEDMVIEYPDQRRLLLSVTGAPIRDESGKVNGGVIICRDVTERRRMEHTLSEQASQLQAIIEAVPDALYYTDRDGNNVLMNTAGRKLLALHAHPEIDLQGEMVGTYLEVRDSHYTPLPSDQWPSTHILAGEVLTGENSPELVIRTLNNQNVIVDVTGGPVFNFQKEIIGAVTILRDVTQQRALEHRTHEALEALLKMAEALVHLPEQDDSSPQHANTMENSARSLVELIRRILGCQRVGLTAIDPTTHQHTSLAAVGISPEQEVRWKARQPGFSILELLQQANENDVQSIDKVVVVDFTKPSFSRAENPFNIQVMVLAPIYIGSQLIGMLSLDHGNQHHVYDENELTLVRAIAQLVALVMERERLLRERAEVEANALALRETNRLMDEFIGIAGHELRTPLTTIKASVQLARRQIARIKQQAHLLPTAVMTSTNTIQDLLERAERQIGMQNRLVSDLLDVSRIQSGRLELHPAACDIAKLVQDTVIDQRSLTPTRTINLHISPTDTPFVEADADRIRQVITNFLSNALKYSDADKAVNVSVEQLASSVKVAVQDEGPGLTPEQQKRIWERFYRAPGIDIRSGSGVGLGLGLHISQMIIERQGGQVGVDSIPGQGSTFWFTLPMHTLEQNAEV